MEGLDLATFMEKYPHNTDCGDKFVTLVTLAYQKDTSGLSLEEFVQRCINRYGGTIAGAMIDYLNNQ